MFGNLSFHNLFSALKAAQNPRRLIFDCGILRRLALWLYIVKLGHCVSQRHFRFPCEGTTGREQSLDWAELSSIHFAVSGVMKAGVMKGFAFWQFSEKCDRAWDSCCLSTRPPLWFVFDRNRVWENGSELHLFKLYNSWMDWNVCSPFGCFWNSQCQNNFWKLVFFVQGFKRNYFSLLNPDAPQQDGVLWNNNTETYHTKMKCCYIWTQKWFKHSTQLPDCHSIRYQTNIKPFILKLAGARFLNKTPDTCVNLRESSI